MKYFSLFVAIFFFTQKTFAQLPFGNHGNFNNPQFNVGHFYGKIIDGKSNKPIEFATIQLFQNRFDTVSKQRKMMLISGALTQTNGDFSIENLPVMGEYNMKVTAIGYDSLSQKISF